MVFTPVADKFHAVRGEPTPERSAVWIEDVEASTPVTEKIVKAK